jgi:hypothetical protein
LYNQHVKAGVTFAGTFDEHFARYRERYDYRAMVTKLGAVFGPDSIVVRPYEREQFFGDSIFADFMHHAFETESVDALAIPKRDQNSRLDRDALEFKRLVNGLDEAKEHKLEIGRHLIKYCAKVDPRIKEAFQAHELLSPQQRLELLEVFAEGNAWIARTYLGRSDCELFLEPWPSAGTPWTPYAGLTAAKAAELAFHVYRSVDSEAREREAKWARADRSRSGSGSRPSEGRVPEVKRTVKRFWKRQFRHGRALVSRLRPGPKAKSGTV